MPENLGATAVALVAPVVTSLNCKDVSDLETCMEYLFFLPNRTEKTVHSAVSLNIFGRLLDFFQRESSIFHNFFLEA